MREAGAPLEYSDARAMHIYAHELQRIISGCNYYLQPFVFVMNILVQVHASRGVAAFILPDLICRSAGTSLFPPCCE
jgi:hypothetical protein